tara:strand:+ start:1539 stop:2396 length:858 start_codon:yes stop_codon:yes gene_type:complete
MSKFIKYLIQSIVIYFFFIIGKLLGLSTSKKFFSLVFEKIGPYFKSKIVIDKNLKIFNPDLTSDQKAIIINDMWRNYGMTFIEYIHLDFYKKKLNFVEIEGEEYLKKIIGSKKQVIFVSGHFSNFEIMSMEITKRKVKLATIYRPLNNYFLNPFMEYLRKKYVCSNQIKKGLNGVRDAINFIKNGFSIALMIDQRVSEGEKINFFNKPALTTTLPAQLAIKYNLSIVPVFIERLKSNKFKITFHNEINSSLFKDTIDLSKKLNQILEKMITKKPNEWIWTHNRWK